jgi:uncharacterized protein YycO
MKYDVIRPQIKTGDILAWSHRGWGTWYDFQIQMIRMFTRSDFCHVAIAYVEHDRVFAFEAVGSGIRMNPLSNDIPFYWVRTTEEILPETISWAFKQIGKKYQSKWKMVLDFFRESPKSDNDRYQCSQLVIAFRDQNKNPLTDICTPDAVVNECWDRYDSVHFVEV